MKTENFTLDKIGVDADCLERVLRYEGTPGINVERHNMAMLSDTLQKEANYLSILFGKYSRIPMPSGEISNYSGELIDERNMKDKCYNFKSGRLSIENRFIQDVEPGTFAQYLGIELSQLFGGTCIQYFNHIVRVSYETGDKPVRAVINYGIEKEESLFKQQEKEKKLWEMVKNIQINTGHLANVIRMNAEIREAVHSTYERALRDPAYFEKAKRLPVKGNKWK